MSSQIYDCKTLSPLDPGTPYYHECFGFFQLPRFLRFEAGPFENSSVNVPPDLPCNLINKQKRTGLLERTSDTGDQADACSFTYGWGDGELTMLLAVNENKVPLTTKQTLSGSELLKWRVLAGGSSGGMVGVHSSAYCTFNMSANSATLTIQGQLMGELCKGPFSIWFDPVASPLEY